jgi:histidinol dehydrogenase
MKIIEYPERKFWKEILKRPTLDFEGIADKVSPILQNVKLEGDIALRNYALEFDNILIDDFRVSKSEVELAISQINNELKAAIDQAFSNIYAFHKKQVSSVEVIETMPGVECWRKSVAIEKVGIYIPGGTAPLFSTVLMLGIPAMIAGCKQVILCSPSNHPAIYYAAHKVGVTDIFRVGGAQAIAAMAYGTDQIPQVYKIFGPGNQYVTAAKQIVSSQGVSIDMPAGPSEVAILVDQQANPAYVAADLLSQAEHGTDSQVLLVSTSPQIIDDTLKKVFEQVELLPRKELALKALENSKAILLKDQVEAISLLNEYAPEHLILAVENADDLTDKIVNAGSVFIGNYTPESCGDYASGTNHTLPTNGFAKAYSGVSVDSFVKKITFQKISEIGLKNLGPTVEVMAENEQLFAHKNAVSIRLKDIL